MEILPYLLKVNLILGVCWLVYRALFYRLTFFQANRWLLLGSMLAALTIPLLTLPATEVVAVATLDLPITYINEEVPAEVPAVRFNWPFYLSLVWLVGCVLYLLRFGIRLMALLKVWKNSQAYVWEGFRFYRLTGNQQPFSFFGFIFLNPAQFSDEERRYVLRHEQVHVRQIHCLDILLAELLLCLSWWNPLLRFFRNDLKTNLEFIADQEVLKSGICKKSYQLSLLHVVGEQAGLTLTPSFSFFQLKPRIKMMNMQSTGLLSGLRYLLLIPVLLGLTLSCAEEEEVFEVPPPPPHPETGMSVVPPPPAHEGELAETDEMHYYLNDERVEETAIKALKKDEIVGIDIMKGENGIRSVFAYTQQERYANRSTQRKVEFKQGQQHTPDETLFQQINDGDFLLIIDGKEVSVEEFQKLNRDMIQTIDVRKEADGSKTISVITKDNKTAGAYESASGNIFTRELLRFGAVVPAQQEGC